MIPMYTALLYMYMSITMDMLSNQYNTESSTYLVQYSIHVALLAIT